VIVYLIKTLESDALMINYKWTRSREANQELIAPNDFLRVYAISIVFFLSLSTNCKAIKGVNVTAFKIP